MKKLLLLFVLFPLFSVSAGGGTGILIEPQKDPGVIRLEKMFSGQEIFIDSYKLSQLDTDIKAKADENDEYDNTIQAISKEPTWNKALFLNFANALKRKDTKEASMIYNKNYAIVDPFLPICCVAYSHIGTRAMKNGILSIHKAGQELMEYSFHYVFYRNGYLYSIKKTTGFLEDFDDEKELNSLLYNGTGSTYDKKSSRVIIKKYSYNSDFDTQNFQKWLIKPELNPYFLKSYNSFVNDMTRLWN